MSTATAKRNVTEYLWKKIERDIDHYLTGFHGRRIDMEGAHLVLATHYGVTSKEDRQFIKDWWANARAELVRHGVVIDEHGVEVRNDQTA